MRETASPIFNKRRVRRRGHDPIDCQRRWIEGRVSLSNGASISVSRCDAPFVPSSFRTESACFAKSSLAFARGANPRGRGEALSANCVPSSVRERLHSLAELIDFAESHNPETRVSWENAMARVKLWELPVANCFRSYPPPSSPACSGMRFLSGFGSIARRSRPFSLTRSQLHHFRFWRSPRANRCGACAVTGGKLRLQ